VAHQTVSGLVPLSSVWWIYDEIAQRVGMVEGAKLAGISYDNLRLILYRRSHDVQRRNVRTAIETLRSLRADNIWRRPTNGRPMAYARRKNWTRPLTF
jgi:hypothetical protein